MSNQYAEGLTSALNRIASLEKAEALAGIGRMGPSGTEVANATIKHITEFSSDIERVTHLNATLQDR